MAWGAEMWLPGSSYVEPSTTEVEIIHGIASSPRKWALPLLPPRAKEVSMAQQTVKSRAPANQEGMKSRGHWNREAFVRHRDYSPTLGRFIERDPIGFEAGDNNWYRFVANGPTIGVDPLGLAEAQFAGGATSWNVSAYTNRGAVFFGKGVNAGFLKPGDKPMAMNLAEFEALLTKGGAPSYRILSGVDAVGTATIDNQKKAPCYYWNQQIKLTSHGKDREGLPPDQPWGNDFGERYPSSTKGNVITLTDSPGWGAYNYKIQPLFTVHLKTNTVTINPPDARDFETLRESFSDYHGANNTSVKWEYRSQLMYKDPAANDAARRVGSWEWGLTLSLPRGKAGGFGAHVEP